MKQAIEKLETELLLLKEVNIRDWNALSVWGMIFRIVTAEILHRKQNKKNRENYIFVRQWNLHTACLALTWKVEH